MRWWFAGHKLLSVLCFCFGFLALGTPTASAQDAPRLGGPGESCRAAADCTPGLRCVDNQCHDEREGAACAATSECGALLVCVDQVCVIPGTSGDEDDLWSGIHPTFGVVVAPGPTLIKLWPADVVTRGSILFGLRVGLYVSHFEMTMELAPVTHLLDFEAKDPVLSFTTTFGGLISITDHFYWPLRARLGLASPVTVDAKTVWGNIGWDVIGIGYRMDNGWQLEFDLASFRCISDFNNNSWFNLLMGLAVNYVL